jgi:hypothetical protein
VRDPMGRCALVLSDDDWCPGSCTDDQQQSALARMRDELRKALGAHAFPGEAVLMPPAEHPLAESILQDPLAIPMLGEPRIKLLDRLQTNQDWLCPPLRTIPRLPLGVAYSIKGGVGRSTALAVLALALAREGKRVVVVDLDLEAPGIGSLLLGEELPAYGLVDWLVEGLVGTQSAALVTDMVMRAPVVNAAGLAGDLRVIPAWGEDTQDYVAKLGRAYLPTMGANGRPDRFANGLDGLMEVLADSASPPDVVLMDARAGLHDIGAAAVTQLGAQVFLFARDDPQNWRAYQRLFEHLRQSPQIGTADEDDDLRLRLKLCAAMMDDLGVSLDRWIDNAYETCLTIYDTEDSAPYSFSRDAFEAPHYPLPIAFSSVVKGQVFVGPRFEEQWAVVAPAFERFIMDAIGLLFATSEPLP